jgi:hypothetical protein
MDGIGISNLITTTQKTAFNSVTFSDGIININISALRIDSIKTLNLGNTVQTIQGNAFLSCKIGSLVLPEDLKRIDGGAFSNCSLSGELVIPGKVENIGASAFNDNPGINQIIIRQNRNSGDSTYNPTAVPPVYKKSPINVVSYVPFGALNAANRTYFMDDPRPVGTTNIVHHPQTNSLIIYLRMVGSGSPPPQIDSIKAGNSSMPQVFIDSSNTLNPAAPWVARMEVDSLHGNDNYIFEVFFKEGGLSKSLFYTVTIDHFHSLSYNGNGDTTSVMPGLGYYIENVKIKVRPPSIDTSNTEYHFEGWAKTAGAAMPFYKWNGTTFSPDTLLMPDKNTVLYAVWTGEITICEGDSLNFYAQIVAVGDDPHYQWQVNGDDMPGANDTVFTYAPHNGDTIRCMMVSTVCNVLDTVMSQSIIAIVNPRADSSFIQAMDTVYTCYNTSPELSVLTSISHVPHPRHRWYDSQTSNVVLHEGSIFFPPNLTMSRSYFVSVYDSTATVCENDTNHRKEIKVIVYDIFTAGTIGSSYDMCITQSPAMITEISPRSGGSDTVSHLWQMSNDSLYWISTGVTTTNYTPSSLTPGTYYFRRADTDSKCGTVHTEGVKVVVYDEPVLNTDITGDNTVCKQGNSITLSNATPGGVWTCNKYLTLSNPTANSVTVTGALEGKGFVTYTVFNGVCEIKKTFHVKVVPNTTPDVSIGIER